MNIEPQLKDINPKAWDFFDQEIADAGAKILIEFSDGGDVRANSKAKESLASYAKFVRWLFLGDKVYIGPFKSALAFEKQMTFDQYTHYRDTHGWTYQEMAECVLDFENNRVNQRGGNKYVMFARTMENWINNARHRKPSPKAGFSGDSPSVAKSPRADVSQ